MTTLATSPTQTTNWQDLCAQLRADADVDVLLDLYNHLDPMGRNVAAALLDAFQTLNKDASTEALATVTVLRALTAGDAS